MGIKGDFTGFTFDGVHSSQLGITRVSDGDRYNEKLFAEIEDKTGEVPGLDGNYYFGSTFKTNTITLQIAYDSITEQQFRRIRQLFSTKKICNLVFDERPYKRYLVKIANPIELNYVCFDGPIIEISSRGKGIHGRDIIDYNENGTQRMYKGEGSIELVGYYPFAKSVFKVLPDESEIEEKDKKYPNIDEWADSSKLLTAEQYQQYDKIETVTVNGESQKVCKLYNPGDISTGLRFYCPFIHGNSSYGVEGLTIKYWPEDFTSEDCADAIVINSITTADTNDIGMLINTDLGLIYGVTEFSKNGYDISYKLSNRIYNEYLQAGNFFKIQPTIQYVDEHPLINNARLQIVGGNDGMEVFYDYLYM